jgi:hypothetical protein
MRIALSIVLLLLAIATGAVLATESAKSSDISHSAQSEENVAALRAAYAYAAKGHIATDSKIVTLQREGRIIVVQFASPCSLQHHCYGGQLRVFYDPAKHSVVRSEGED